MKSTLLFTLWLVLMSFSLANHIAASTVDRIDEAVDYAKAGLSEKAKDILIEQLHSSKDSTLFPTMWFLTGDICRQEKNYDGTSYFWGKVIQYAPNSREADLVRMIVKFVNAELAISINQSVSDYMFDREYELSFRLWSYVPPDWHMDWKQVEDVRFALRYLNRLLSTYSDDPAKKAALLYEKFLILAGYNGNGFGLRNGQTEYIEVTTDTSLHKMDLLTACESISDSIGSISGEKDLYVRSQFLIGLIASDTVKNKTTVYVNAKSEKYFRNVLNATEDEVANPYQIFASIWLRRFLDENIRIPHYPTIGEFVAVDNAPKIRDSIFAVLLDPDHNLALPSTVRVSVLVDISGEVINVVVSKSTENERIDNAAIEAAKHRRYEPATKDGHPVPYWVTYMQAVIRK